ncbi:MAG: hypothetical protein BWY53_00646 [Parcubacteria group bacterium ADurb.Bin326]|nr:MAG: hypothetical protein BWY53_00646 [Parcubacteria group bacterium ADurb.Bin326]
MAENQEVTVEVLRENLENLENLGKLLMSIPRERLQEMRKGLRETGGNNDLVEYIDIELSSRGGLFGRS